MATYPKRPAFFGIKAIRKMVKACVAQEIGDKAALLLVVIASCEDAKRYTGPVTYFNDQLLPLIATRKWDTLDRARRAAVSSGWLHYDAGGTRKPGRYWIMIPESLRTLDDSPTDEDLLPPATGDNRGYNPPDYPRSPDTTNGPLSPLTGDSTGDNTGYSMGDNRGEPSSLPLPVLSQEKRARASEGRNDEDAQPAQTAFVPPTLIEVAAYCSNVGYPSYGKAFVAHFKSRGWLHRDGTQVMDWQADVDAWHAREPSFSGGDQVGGQDKDPPRGALALDPVVQANLDRAARVREARARDASPEEIQAILDEVEGKP